MSKKTAKPCPFCEGPANLQGYPDYGYDAWCPECQTEQMHIDDWNRRPAEDRLRAALGELIPFVEGIIEYPDDAVMFDAILAGNDIDPESLAKPESG